MKDCRFGYNVTSYGRAVKKGRLVVINCTVALSAIVGHLAPWKDWQLSIFYWWRTAGTGHYEPAVAEAWRRAGWWSLIALWLELRALENNVFNFLLVRIPTMVVVKSLAHRKKMWSIIHIHFPYTFTSFEYKVCKIPWKLTVKGKFHAGLWIVQMNGCIAATPSFLMSSCLLHGFGPAVNQICLTKSYETKFMNHRSSLMHCVSVKYAKKKTPKKRKDTELDWRKQLQLIQKHKTLIMKYNHNLSPQSKIHQMQA